MSTEDPTMIDVAMAVGPEGTDVLNFIVRHQEAERAHWQGIQEAWYLNALAELKAIKDGIWAALGESEFGGTTKQYELSLSRMSAAIDAASPAMGGGPIYQWYREQFAKDQFFKGIHPAYQRQGGSS